MPSRVPVRRKAPRGVLVLLTLASLAPLGVLAVQSMAATWRYPEVWPARLDVGAFVDLLRSSRLRDALFTSITLAVATGVASMLMAFVAARALSRASGTVRRLGAASAFLPVVAPPVALGVGLQVAMLSVGLGGRWEGVLLSHVVPATGYVTLYFLGVLTAYDAGIEEAARTLGASPRQVFLRVTLPALRPRLTEGALLGALVSWGQLALTLVVGGGAVRTLPVELLSSLRAGDDRVGASAALVLAAVPALGLLASRRRWRAAGAPP